MAFQRNIFLDHHCMTGKSVRHLNLTSMCMFSAISTSQHNVVHVIRDTELSDKHCIGLARVADLWIVDRSRLHTSIPNYIFRWQNGQTNQVIMQRSCCMTLQSHTRGFTCLITNHFAYDLDCTLLSEKYHRNSKTSMALFIVSIHVCLLMFGYKHGIVCIEIMSHYLDIISILSRILRLLRGPTRNTT